MSPLNTSRRSFLRLVSATAASTSVRHSWSDVVPTPIGAQLYTVQTEVMSDLASTLVALKKIGFQMVESFAAMHERPAKELRKMVEDAGLMIPSAHFAFDTFEEKLEYAHELGIAYMVCAMLPKPMQNRDGFIKAAEKLNKAGEMTKAINIKLAFHNHNFEFQSLAPLTDSSAPDPNDIGLKILLDRTNPDFVFWEEDCYWVAQGGLDPLQLLQRNKARIPLLHLKDRKDGAATSYGPGKPSQNFTEIGTGTIDWEPIVRLAVGGGKLMFIEQDITTLPPMESLAFSYKKLQKYIASAR